MSLQIPTVTVDDLRQFHSRHFPTAPLPTLYLAGADHTGTTEDAHYDDDGLGYYDDGVKRTITDEQIAMFRHSEIHAILRARRRKRDREEEEEDGETGDSPSPKRVKPGPLNDTPTPQITEADQDSTSVNETQRSLSIKDNSSHASGYGNNWVAVSAKSKAKSQRRNAKNRMKNKENRRAKKKQSCESSAPSRETTEDQDGDKSDEWDPWHQANGPDVQTGTNIELDY